MNSVTAMSGLFRYMLFAIGLLLVAATVAACGGGSDTPPANNTTTFGSQVPTVSDTTFAGGDLEPKERTGRADFLPAATVGRIAGVDRGPYNRITFFFFTTVPDYRAEYVDAPIACGSGLPLEIEGEAFLQLTTQPASGHDNQGEVSYVLPTDFQETLPAILDLQQSCDFEGELTWVFGLPERLDFRMAFTTVPLSYESVVIDIKNPE